MDYLPDIEIDELTGKPKIVQLQQNSLVYSPLNRKLLYTKAEVDAKTSGLQTALDAKEATANKDATGGYAGLTLSKINFKNDLNTITSFFTNANTVARTYTFQDRDGTIADNTDLALKAPLASPTFTGTIAGITKAMVGLDLVDDTADLSKPVSTAQQTALNLKQDLIGKDATGGYAGLTLFKINFKNALNTITSFFTNANTVARTYTFQDRDGTIADNTDLALKVTLAGTAGGQTINGGTGASENLTLKSTSNATKGKLLLGTSAYDEVNNRLGIGTTGPGYKLDVRGDVTAGDGTDGSGIKLRMLDGVTVLRTFDPTNTGTINSINFGAVGAGGDLRAHGQNFLFVTTIGTEYARFVSSTGSLGMTGNLTVSGTGNSSIAGNVGVGTTTPTSKLQVVGIPIYANNAAAITGGLTAGAFYRTGADPDPLMIVH